MDASRLVFVSVKDAKQRRKIAVPIPDDYTWDQFLQQVKVKLKLTGVDSIYLVSSGEKITRLEDLQDIDELNVVEAAAPSHTDAVSQNGGERHADPRNQSGAGATTSGPSNASANGNYVTSDQAPVFNTQHSLGQASSVHRVAIADVSGAGHGGGDGEGDMGQKYTKRSSGIRRSLQRVFPAFFQPGLPVTNRDVKEEGRKGLETKPSRRRRKARTFTLRNMVTLIIVLGFLAVLSMLYSQLWPRRP